jgi:alpha-ketoglutarate-dependent taurine dioxygenase
MQQMERKTSQLDKLRGIRRKAVEDVTGINAVHTTEVIPGERLPLSISPAVPGLDLLEWARSNRDWLREKLLHHGGIHLRFGIDSLETFEQFALTQVTELFGEYGDLPRAGTTSGKIYQSTPYPEDQAILFHNESSHMHCWPMRIMFFCVQNAQQGGETPIMDCRKAYDEMDPAIRQKFEDLGVMYVRNFTDGLDVSWQHFFQTEDRTLVEKYCRAAGIICEWKPDGGLRTRQIRDAVKLHPDTGEKIFFNQIQLHHIAALAPKVREALQSMFSEEDLPRHVHYGDGSPIPNEVMDYIGDFFNRIAVVFPWQEGDIIMLDNMLTCHARNPYVGPRRITVAMGEMAGRVVRQSDLA